MQRHNEQWVTKGWVIAALAGVAALLWGSAYPCIKIGLELFSLQNASAFDKMFYAGIRFVFAGLLTLAAMAVVRRKKPLPELRNIPKIMLLGFTQTGLQYFFFYIGLSATPGSKGAIISATTTLITVIISAIMFKNEKLTLYKLAGCLIGLLGAVIVNFSSAMGGFEFGLTSEGFVLFSAIAFSVGTVYSKYVAQNEDVFAVSGYQLFFGGSLLAAAGYIGGGRIAHVTAGGIGMLAYLIVLSAVAFTLWTLLLSANHVARVTVYYSLVPVFGVILSGVLLGEDVLNLRSIAALALVCLGICIVNGRKGVQADR